VCTPVDSLSDSISHVLASVEWPTLKSLVFSSNSIDVWINLWPPPVAPRLLSLQIQGSEPNNQELAHLSILFLHRLICASPLFELCRRYVHLQYKRDWVLIIDSVDFSILKALDLGDHGSAQLLSVPDAIDLFGSRLEEPHLEIDGPKLLLPSFTLDLQLSLHSASKERESFSATAALRDSLSSVMVRSTSVRAIPSLGCSPPCPGPHWSTCASLATTSINGSSFCLKSTRHDSCPSTSAEHTWCV